MPNEQPSFDVLEVLDDDLVNVSGYFQPSEPRMSNLTYLKANHAQSNSSTSDKAEGHTPETKGSNNNALALTTLISDVADWRGGDNPTTYKLIELILVSTYTAAIMWLLGTAKASAIPAEFSMPDVTTAPQQWV
eukprot:scaffold141424_cov178-Phaeocystis_antarctica.AAC.1